MTEAAPRTPATGPRRVGLFGGAFDPPHRAHRALAAAAVQQLGLDVLYIVPTGDAWHRAQVLTPGDQRFASRDELRCPLDASAPKPSRLQHPAPARR